MTNPRTDIDETLYELGNELLTVFETLHADYDPCARSDLAVSTQPLDGIENRISDEYWNQPDMADWKAISTRTDDGEYDPELELADWTGLDSDCALLQLALRGVEEWQHMSADTTTATGLWVPSSDPGREYRLIVTGRFEPSEGRGYLATVNVCTDGEADCRLSLRTPEMSSPIPIFDMPLVVPDDVDPRPFQNELGRARTSNWARVIVGSHAADLAERTTLSYTEALIHLLDGVEKFETDEELANCLGFSRSTISSVRNRITGKYEEAQDRIDENKRTIEVLDHVSVDAILTNEWDGSVNT